MNGTGCCYEIRVAEAISPAWSSWFGEMEISADEEGTGAVLRGALPDQAALFGLLGRIRNLNLTLIELKRINL